MKNIVFYIITGLIFVIYRVFYNCYYSDMLGYVRVTNINSILLALLFIWPLIVFILLIVLAYKIGSKHCFLWDTKAKTVTAVIIIMAQLVPLGWFIDTVLPYGFSKKY